MILYEKNTLNYQKKRVRNIILTGICGSGKTTIGKQLALRLGYGFLDLDEWIEKSSNMEIADIFDKHGENFFRLKEVEAISEIKTISNHVISLGGGTLESEKNWEILSDLGLTIWLKLSPQTIAHRFNSQMIELKKRPLLSDIASISSVDERKAALIDRLERQLQQRSHRLKQSDVHYSDGFATTDEAASRIRELLEGHEPQDLVKSKSKRNYMKKSPSDTHS